MSKRVNFADLYDLTVGGEKKESPTSQPTAGSQPAESRQPVEPPPDGPVSSQPIVSSQPTQSSQPTGGSHSLLETLPEVAGHSELPHRFTDHLCRWLTPDEQAVYLQLYRLSWGWGKETCLVSNPRLSERSNVPLSTLKRVVNRLISKELIKKTNREIGYGKEQGIEYRVFRLSSQPKASRQPAVSSQPTAGTNKEKLLKENTKQGFDASLCPDCMGTGFYYPEGTEKGVKRCEHKKLR